MYQSQQAWIIKGKTDGHNHSRLEADLLPSNRRRKRQDAEFDERLGQVTKVRKLSGEYIARRLREEFPGSGIVSKDVQNRCDQERLATYQNRTPTQQFVMEIQEQEHRREAYLRFKTEGDRPDGPLQYIFWTYRWCIDMWRDNWEIISIDDTYKTNRFNMPLAQITGVTDVNTTFNIAWGLLVDETKAIVGS